MASTRKVNNYDDYLLEQKVNQTTNNYMTYKSYGTNQQTYNPGFGLLPGRLAPTHIASNYCDIESNLRGIGSTNLVKPLAPLRPDIYHLSTLNIADNKPPLIMPDDLNILPNQRANIQS
jgi:hypothetical protein